jgi:hypothetical protein
VGGFCTVFFPTLDESTISTLGDCGAAGVGGGMEGHVVTIWAVKNIAKISE